jgi:hypothetical protein
MPSAFEIITSAMKIAGVLGQNETPIASEADDGLIALNDLLASWGIERTYVYTISHDNFTLIANQQAYTIGPTGDYVAARPNKITNAFVRWNGNDFPLVEINSADYSTIQNKSIYSLPTYYYYEPSFPNGTLTLWSGPDSAYALHYDSWTQLTEFPDLTTQVTFPPGYYRLLRYVLAPELAPMYGVSLTPEAVAIGMEAKANVRNLNLPAPIMKTEVGILSGIYGNYGDWRY